MKYQENEKEIEKNIENVKKNMVVQMLQLLITEKLIKLENAFNKDAYTTLNEWIKVFKNIAPQKKNSPYEKRST